MGNRNVGLRFGAWILAQAAVAYGAVGCSADVGQEAGVAGGPGESVAVAQEELTSCTCDNSTYQTFTVTNGFVLGPTVSENICWPTLYDRVTPEGSVPFLIMTRRGNNWALTGVPGDNRSSMTCVKQCCFFSNGGSSDVRWVSGDFGADAVCAKTSQKFIETTMWAQDSMAILEGSVHTGAAHVPAWDGSYVFDSSSGSPWKVGAACAGDGTNGSEMFSWGYNFFVGIPNSSHNVKKFESLHIPKSSTVSLIESRSGICTLSAVNGVAGDDGSNAYAVKLSRPGGIWTVTTQSHIQSVNAACYMFDQQQL